MRRMVAINQLVLGAVIWFVLDLLSFYWRSHEAVMQDLHGDFYVFMFVVTAYFISEKIR
jgi:hypothetical protein